MYKPMIFIFLVVVAPGITDAMFYYEANVLEFTSTNFGYLGVISCFASIIGVWVYRAFCTKLLLKWYFLGITIALSLALLSNLLIVNTKGTGLKMAYS
jgi:Na+/melibiose symporter-like transporter